MISQMQLPRSMKTGARSLDNHCNALQKFDLRKSAISAVYFLPQISQISSEDNIAECGFMIAD